MLSALRRLFSREPYELFFANNAKLALQIVAQKRIDIAVSDHRMPGMTGVEFFEQLFQKHRLPAEPLPAVNAQGPPTTVEMFEDP